MAHPIKTYRAANDLTLEDFARLLSVQPSTISRIETRKQEITPEMAIAVEQVTARAVRRHELRPDLWEEISR